MRFQLSSKDFEGLVERNTLFFVGGCPCCFPEKRGLEGQGIIGNDIVPIKTDKRQFGDDVTLPEVWVVTVIGNGNSRILLEFHIVL